MLIENTLFGEIDKVKNALTILRDFEKQAIDMHSDGYYVAFSGGKDSIVILDLVRRAGVKHTALYHITTVDPPELVRYIHKEYPTVKCEKPEKSMYRLIVENMMPPTRIVRYCCRVLKEHGGDNRFIITGIRHAESVRRDKRQKVERCFKTSSNTLYLHPIIEWSNDEVWQYIRENDLKYCSLYDEGFKRIGCIGCPMSNKRKEQFKRWPSFKRYYQRAFAEVERKRKIKNIPAIKWNNAEELFDWWMGEKTSKENSDQTILFE